MSLSMGTSNRSRSGLGGNEGVRAMTTDTVARTRILVVDPQPSLLAPLQVQLEDAGFELVLTHSALEAIEQTERCPPALAVLDFDLPGGTSGLRLAETLRRLHSIPVLFYSATIDEQALRAAEMVGALRALSKDMHIEEVVAAIRETTRHLEDAQPTAQEATRAPHEWDARARKEHLIGIYTAVWSETPEQVKSCLNRFSRNHNTSLERIAEEQAQYQRDMARLHQEYQSKLAALRPPVLLALHRFHERHALADGPVHAVATSAPRTGALRRPA